MDFLTGLKALIDTLGSTVLLPVFIFIFAVALGTKVGRAFRSAVTIGVAFVGINLVIGLMLGNIANVSTVMMANTGIERDIIDVGWPAAAAIAFGSDVGLWVIPVALLVNVVLLATRLTKTLNVDIWNFWHFAFAGSLVYFATDGNLALGIVAAAVAAALMLFFADWTAPAVQEFYNLPGISIPHGTSTAYVALAIPINLLLDRIPGLKDLDADPDAIERRFGPTFGDPMVMGLLIGIVLGLIAYTGNFATDALGTTAQILVLGVNLAAVMVLLPRMVSILMEGLIPISEAAREFMQKRASDREVYIGLDSAILIGHPSVISASLVLVPIAILLSVILPGNRMILAADLAVFPFVIALTGPITKGNVVRMIIIGTLIITVGFYLGNAMAPLTTEAAAASGFTIPEGATQISSVADGFIWIPWAFMVLGGSLQWVGIILFAVVIGVFWFFYKQNTAAWEAAAGGPAAEAAAAD